MVRKIHWIRWILAGLLGIELIYVAASAIFLNSTMLKREIDSNPANVMVDYDFAISPFPCLGWVWNPFIRIQDENMQMFIRLASAEIWVNPRALLRKEFHGISVNGGTTQFRLRFRKDPNKIEASRRDALPDIPGLPRLDKPKFKGADTKDPWKLRFSNIHIAHLNEIWVEQYRFAGDVSVDGGFFLFPSKGAEVYPSRVRFRSGAVFVGNNSVMNDIRADIRAHIDNFVGDDVPDLEILKYTQGNIDFKSQIENVSFANYYLKSLPWLELNRGHGLLDSHIVLNHGLLEVGSRAQLDADKLEARMWHQWAVGNGKLDWSVEDEDHRKLSHLRLHLNQFEFQDVRRKDARVFGENLEVAIKSPSLDLRKPQEAIDIHIDMPRVDVSSLKAANLYLPEKSRVRFLAGNARISGYFDGSTEHPELDRGQFVAATDNAQVALGKMELSAKVSLAAKLNRGNMNRGTLDLDGTHLEINNLTVKGQNDKPWTATVDLPKADITLNHETSANVTIAMKSTNARPLVEGFLSISNSSLPGWIQGLLTMENFAAGLSMRVGKDNLELNNLKAGGGSFQVKGWLNEREDYKKGRFLVEYGPLAAGLALETDGMHLRLQDAYGWWKQQRSE
jgi:hypothetical protein